MVCEVNSEHCFPPLLEATCGHEARMPEGRIVRCTDRGQFFGDNFSIVFRNLVFHRSYHLGKINEVFLAHVVSPFEHSARACTLPKQSAWACTTLRGKRQLDCITHDLAINIALRCD